MERFSLGHLRQLHRNLDLNKSVSASNEGMVIEILREIAEMVVYGDSKSEMLFDFFCEKNMLALFLEIMWTEGGCSIKVRCFARLCTCTRCLSATLSASVCALLSYLCKIVS